MRRLVMLIAAALAVVALAVPFAGASTGIPSPGQDCPWFMEGISYPVPGGHVVCTQVSPGHWVWIFEWTGGCTDFCPIH